MGKLILIVAVIAIVIIACWQIYNHRKEEEAFWSDKHTSKKYNNDKIQNALESIVGVSSTIHEIRQNIIKMRSQINELERGMQNHYERLNKLEEQLKTKQVKTHSKEKS